MLINRKKIIKSCILITCIIILCYKPSYAKTNILKLNPKENHVYEKLDAQQITMDMSNDKKSAKNTYDGKHVIIVDKISDIKKNRKNFSINNYSKTIECTYDDKLDESIESGNVRVLFGKINISTLGKGEISFNVDKIERDIEKYVDVKYGLLDGSTISKSQIVTRNLGSGIYQYSILNNWTEHEEKLDNVDGYVYNLNEISGSGSAEKLFVFYIDEHQLDDPKDISKSKKVYEAIVKNIFLNPNLKMHKDYVPLLNRDVTINDVTDDYSYQNYNGNYIDGNGYKHRVEFLFPEEHDNTYICFLYIYYEEEYDDEVLMLTKSIK